MTAACWFTLALVGFAAASDDPTTQDTIDIGARRELFVDTLLIDRLSRRPIRLRFVMEDADLFSLRFRE